MFKPRDLYSYECGELSREEVYNLLDKSAHLVAFYNHIADALLAYWQGKVFVDKIWPRRYRLHFVNKNFPEARWLHIVRDGRDSFCSARRHPHVPQGRDLERFARYWNACNRLVEQVVPAKRRLLIKYEELVSDPKVHLPRIMDFLDLEVETGQYNPSEAGRIASIRKTEHHRRIAQPLDRRSVGRYLEELSDSQRAQFWSIAKKGLIKYGYDSP